MTHTIKRYTLLAGSIGLALLLMFALLPSLRVTPTLAYSATVRVEINPAFDLIVDEDDLVVEIIKLNDDALAFDSEPWIGLPVEEVIDALIAFAIEAGFIDEEYLESDVVMITLVSDDEEEDEEVKEEIDNLGKRIEAYLADKEEGTEVDVMFVKATLRELFEADGKEVPLGLYIINGKVLQEDGSLIPVNEVKSNGRGPEVDEDDDEDESEGNGKGKAKGRDKDRPEVDEDDDDEDEELDDEDDDEEEEVEDEDDDEEEDEVEDDDDALVEDEDDDEGDE
jgi:hypothetical protein